MLNLHVVTDLVSQLHGNVTAGMIAETALMKLTADLKAALMINLIVAMAIAFMTHGNVMVGQIVQMDLMRVIAPLMLKLYGQQL